MNSRAVFVAGAHTDVGKTHVACALIVAARARGLTVDALKPVASGFDPAGAATSDPGRLLAALGRPLTTETMDAMSPWRFAAPLAPPMAAKLEGRRLPLETMVAFCRARLASSDADLMLVEGVGGVMSPIAEAATGLDLMRALGLPAILVGGNYLGAISHLLTAAETLRARLTPPLALVVSQSGDPAAPDFGETVRAVTEFADGVKVVAAPRLEPPTWAETLLDLLVR